MSKNLKWDKQSMIEELEEDQCDWDKEFAEVLRRRQGLDGMESFVYDK